MTKLKVTPTEDEPAYNQVFEYKDVDGGLVCQIFLREGYTLRTGELTLTKDNEHD